MTATHDLSELSRLATSGFTGDDALDQAMRIVRRRLRARQVSFVYGWTDGFRHVTTGPDLDFTPIALWLVNRDLTARDAACAFDRTGGRVTGFRPVAESIPTTHVGALLPIPDSVAQMVIASGRWQRGLSAAGADFLTAAVPSLALLLQNALKLVRSEGHRNQLAGLMNITRVIAESEDLEQVLSRLAHGIASVADVLSVTIDIVDGESGEILRCVNFDLPGQREFVDRWRRAAHRPDPIRDQVMSTRRAALFADVQNDPAISPGARAFFSRTLIRSTAVFPLTYKDEVLGVMSIGSARPLAFTADEVDLFEGLAIQVATAASGIKLFHQLAEKSQLLERALEAERDHARRDSLTGVLNHAAIAEVLQHEISRPEPSLVAVVMIDVDDMKVVNDTYGHVSGDNVLIAVAEILLSAGGAIGRYGGDEFLVVLPGMDRPAGERYVAAVLERVDACTVAGPYAGTSIRIEASAGVAVFPQEGGTIVDLIKAADTAMYSAKSIRRAQQSGARHDERAAKMIGELVPLLTSPGDLHTKLQLVSERLSSVAGYDAVECRLFPRARGDGRGTPGLSTAKGRRWAERPIIDDHPLHTLLRATRRPVVIDDAGRDERLTEEERGIIAAAGLRSGLAAPMLSGHELIGVISVARKQVNAFGARDAQFLAAVANQVSAIVSMSTIVDELQTATSRLAGAQAETVMMLAAAAEAHDHTTGMHLESIRVITETLARELGYDEPEVTELGLAATLHDIGKISVPDVVLSSPMRFDTDDWEAAALWETMKRHSVWGAEFLDGRAGFELAARVARWHHERWDGGGYPDGLRDGEIPEEVAIVTVADALDAMISDRPYRLGRPISAAVAEIERCSGRQFSPKVVDALVRLHQRRALPSREAPPTALAA